VVVYQPGNRRRTILALIVLTAVTLITLDVRGSGPISALRGGAHDVVNPIAKSGKIKINEQEMKNLTRSQGREEGF